MGHALPGEHYCDEHQGNASHYIKDNCTLCKLKKRFEELEDLRGSDSGAFDMAVESVKAHEGRIAELEAMLREAAELLRGASCTYPDTQRWGWLRKLDGGGS